MPRMPIPAVLAAALVSASPALGQEVELAALTDGLPGLITEEELAALLGPEDITADTDLRPYMRPGVPQALRLEVLRAAWRVKPAIRDYVDPALDYAQ